MVDFASAVAARVGELRSLQQHEQRSGKGGEKNRERMFDWKNAIQIHWQ